MMALYLLLIFAISSTLYQRPNCGCEQKPEINVLAVVNGIKITRQDLSIDTKTQVNLVQDAVIAARNQQLAFQINKVLFDAEAKRRGLTSAKLLELEITSKITPPTESEARAFYDENKDRIGRDFSSVKKSIVAQLRTDRENARAVEFTVALRARAQVKVSGQLVTPPRSEADLARVFATVNGVNITSSDIEESLLPLIFQVQQRVYALRKQDLDLRINDLLLEQEAKRLGLTPQALVDQNVRIKVPLVTEEQARAYFNEHKTKLSGDFSELKVQIMQLLHAQEERKLSLSYADQLRKAAAVQIYLTEPQSPNLRQLCCNPVD